MRYGLLFALAILALTTGAVLTFDHISATSITAVPASALPPRPAADTLPSREVATPAAPTAADYARFAESDRAWRARHAKVYSAAELRARGDGTRSPREAMQDHVYQYSRLGDRARAI